MTTNSSGWVPARVAIYDILGPYDAHIRDQEIWNGWLIPAFDRGTVERIAADTQALARQHADEPDAIEIVRIRDGVVEVVAMAGTDEEHVEVIEPTPEGRFPVGAWAWCWEFAD